MKNFIIPTLLLLFCVAPFQATGQTPLKMRDTTIRGPQTFAMIVGISKYKYVRSLAYADKDAEMFRDYLKSPGGGSVKSDNLFCLLNDKAISANFWNKGFQWLKAKDLRKGDRLFIYLAGHGDAIDQDQFFFLSYDCNPAGDKNNYLVAGTIQLYNLKKKIANETGKGVEVFFIMDACRSNELPGGIEGQNFLTSAVSEKRAGEIIMLATGAGQESLEDASIGNGHGLFTYYLVDGLTGSAETAGAPDNKITYEEIQNYVDKNVPSAAQRFNRKQDPYFCCTETQERIISRVDTTYLNSWLKIKKRQNKGPGNSFSGDIERNFVHAPADTTLLQTYSLFNKAISDNKLTGRLSAEYYYETMNHKFANDPYTLDARSTLATEFVNLAQDKVNLYLDCQDEMSPKQKQDMYESGLRLEKAIRIIREDEPDYAKTLMGRMYFLKASGDVGKEGKNGDLATAFQNAYAALAIDPNGAYINNRLATLHLDNNNRDSARYYAEKTTRIAPKWVCAFTTLALVQKSMSNNKSTDSTKSKKRVPKSSTGLTIGGGINQSTPAFLDNPNDNIIAVNSKTTAILDFGINYHINIGQKISVRPGATLVFENTEIVFQRRNTTGGEIIRESVPVNSTSLNLSLPFILRLTGNKVVPYITAGPAFSYMLGQDKTSAALLPVKKSLLMADAGAGIDIIIAKAGMVISPELKYAVGLTDMKDNAANTVYANNLSSLKKHSLTLSLYLRKK